MSDRRIWRGPPTEWDLQLGEAIRAAGVVVREEERRADLLESIASAAPAR